MSFGQQPSPCSGFTQSPGSGHVPTCLKSLQFTQSSDEFFLTASNQIVNDLRKPPPESKNRRSLQASKLGRRCAAKQTLGSGLEPLNFKKNQTGRPFSAPRG